MSGASFVGGASFVNEAPFMSETPDENASTSTSFISCSTATTAAASAAGTLANPTFTKSFRLYDMHCHLDSMENPAHVARDASALELALITMTVTPDAFAKTQAIANTSCNVLGGLGLHPWWVADITEDTLHEYLSSFESLLSETRVIGEVGLDFSPKRTSPDGRKRQLSALHRIAQMCAQTSEPSAPLIVSLHSVAAHNELLDILEETDCARTCTCILHGYGGSCDALWRAVQMGCYFSFGERSLATKRGREYARIIPIKRLLTETDHPQAKHAAWRAEFIAASLETTLGAIANIRRHDVTDLVAENARRILDGR